MGPDQPLRNDDGLQSYRVKPEYNAPRTQHEAPNLPEDILDLVFHELSSSIPPHQRHASPPVLLPSHVSRIWRQAAVADKRLWLDIPLSSPELAGLFLQRSEPIGVAVYVPHDYRVGSPRRQSAIDEILRHPARIRILKYWVWDESTELPMVLLHSQDHHNFEDSPDIEVIGLWSTDIDDSTVAQLSSRDKLHSLTLSGRCSLDIAVPRTLAHLTSMCLYGHTIYLDAFQNLMLCVPGLHHLVLHRATFRQTNADAGTYHLPPTLRTLKVAGRTPFIMHFLSLMKMPDTTRITVYPVDDMDLQYHLLEDPGPPGPDMATLSWLSVQSARTEYFLHAWPGSFLAVLGLFPHEKRLILRPHGRGCIEIIVEGRLPPGQASTHAPFSLMLIHPDIGPMNRMLFTCLALLVTLSGWQEIRLEEGILAVLVEFVIEFITRGSRLQSLAFMRRLEFSLSDARLRRAPLSKNLAKLGSEWPSAQINALSTGEGDLQPDEEGLRWAYYDNA
ncbi:unnamed protein product [Peniophora sp. CBMAI 1063]|nr:unnamed protein product [Peniophora sp. CBMAI 1063]